MCKGSLGGKRRLVHLSKPPPHGLTHTKDPLSVYFMYMYVAVGQACPDLGVSVSLCVCLFTYLVIYRHFFKSRIFLKFVDE